MENGLLYTFSTIAQALGGAFALLSAFVLYRFQSMDRAMWDDSHTLRSVLTSGGYEVLRYDTLRVQGKYAEVIQVIDANIARRIEIGEPYQLSSENAAFFLRLKESVHLHEGLAKAFKYSAWVTGADMFLSVVTIPFAPFIFGYKTFSSILLLIGVCGFTACLGMYWAVIEAALYRQ